MENSFMKLILATLALVLAFDASADQTFTNIDGIQYKIYDVTTDLTAVAYGTQDGEFRAFHVRDCRKGRGQVEAYEPLKIGNDYSHRFMYRSDWHSKGQRTIDGIATYACATALAKARLLK
jgi:hypothetical protein